MRRIHLGLAAAACFLAANNTPTPSYVLQRASPEVFPILVFAPWLHAVNQEHLIVHSPPGVAPPTLVNFRHRASGGVLVVPVSGSAQIAPGVWDLITPHALVPGWISSEVAVSVERGSVRSNSVRAWAK